MCQFSIPSAAKLMRWLKHYYKIGTSDVELIAPPDPRDARKQIEPWLSAVFQSEHLNVLIGNGLTTAVAYAAGVPPVPMAFQLPEPALQFTNEVMEDATASSRRLGREQPNIEDFIRVVNQALPGLRFSHPTVAESWKSTLDDNLTTLINAVLTTERQIRDSVSTAEDSGIAAKRLLTAFLLSFASRTTSRERLHVFTTNYDRLIEFGCDLAGLRVIDRFVGALTPVFRSARVEVDMHYNPPGIRGEPRYLEGVIRLTKLHGSVDWISGHDGIRRNGIPFGAGEGHPDLAADSNSMIIYPNAAKDIETTDFPYAEMFRDLSAALCRPNSVLVTYGYGFGDDHINRVIRDMLTIASTHLVVISFNDADGRIPRFYQHIARKSQISILLGSHLGDLTNLVDHYLPKSAIDTISARRVEIAKKRGALDALPAGVEGEVE
jgi:hypothetical protein